MVIAAEANDTDDAKRSLKARTKATAMCVYSALQYNDARRLLLLLSQGMLVTA